MVCLLFPCVLFDFPSKILQEGQGLWANTPRVSTATGAKENFLVRQSTSFSSAIAATPHDKIVPVCQGRLHPKSEAFHGTMVNPSVCLPSERLRPDGSSLEGN